MVRSSSLVPYTSKFIFSDQLVLKGSDGSIYALGDCTSTSYAPTAQVASQQGAYLARVFNKIGQRDKLQAELDAALMDKTVGKPADVDVAKLQKKIQQLSRMRPFHYSHQGTLAYVRRCFTFPRA